MWNYIQWDARLVLSSVLLHFGPLCVLAQDAASSPGWCYGFSGDMNYEVMVCACYSPLRKCEEKRHLIMTQNNDVKHFK